MRRSAEEWTEIIETCRKSPQPVKRWCESHQISYSAYKYWVSKSNITAESQEVQWVEIPNARKTRGSTSGIRVCLTYKNMPIEIEADTPGAFYEILRGIKEVW